MRPRRLRLTSLLFLFFPLLGALLLGLGVRSFVTTERFLAKASTADGVVVRVVAAGGDTYSPVVRFVTASGQVVEYKDHVGSDPPAYRVGDSVRVFYDPANPQKARLDSWLSRWFGATILTILGVVFLFVGVVLLLLGRESPRMRRGRGGTAPVRGRRRRPRPTPPRAGAEPNWPTYPEPTDDRPQDSRIQDE
jgi:hypothetical protein